MSSERELIQEIRQGSQAAMEVLVKRHYRSVFALAYRHTGSHHAAADITQEVFIKVMQGLKSYREKEKFDRWLYRVAVNCCRDYHRLQYPRSDREEELPPELVDERETCGTC